MWVLEIKLRFLHFMEHVLSLVYVCTIITPATLRRGLRSVSFSASTVASPPLRLTMVPVSCFIPPPYQHQQGLSCVLLYLIGLPEVFRLDEYTFVK